MKLERTLIELSTLTDYGTRYLVESNPKNIHPSKILPKMHQSDILTYTVCNFTYEEILDAMELSLGDFMELKDISDYDLLDGVLEENLTSYFRDMVINGNVEVDELICDSMLKDYVQDNYSVDELFDEDEIVEYASGNFEIGEIYEPRQIKSYVKNTWTVDEFVDWK